MALTPPKTSVAGGVQRSVVVAVAERAVYVPAAATDPARRREGAGVSAARCDGPDAAHSRGEWDLPAN
jgi:hypothetical protein